MSIFKTFTTTSVLAAALCGPAFAAPGQDKASSVEFEVQKQWQLPQSPIDIVHSLDGRYVFMLTNDHKVLVYTAEGNLEGSIPVDKGVNGIDIAPRGEMLFLIDGEKKSFTAMSVDFERNIDISGAPFRGPEDAPVTMVLFTDFECPYCKKAEPMINEVLARNPQNVKLVFKNLPLQFHKYAELAARAALAAEKQGKFWEYHDRLFAADKLDEQAIEQAAVSLNLDMEKWKTDIQSPEITAKINADMQDAQEAGVTGTPTIFINGRQLKERTPQGFQQLIDEELKKKQQ